VPLVEYLEDIQDCVNTMNGMRYIALLLDLNRQVSLALT